MSRLLIRSTMEKPKVAGAFESGFLGGLFETLADKHSQVDVNFQRISIRFPNTGVNVELNGLVTLTVHMRELTDDEKRASAARNVAVMSKP